MLGSIIHNRKWNWVAVGKHPAAKDYIRFGGHSALQDAVAEWLSRGYRKLTGGKKSSSTPHSWRFWLKGVKKGTLVCGLGRDSSDSLGRPYPLLIMGEGQMKGWEKQWPMLPARLENIWRRMEYIAAHRFENTREMQAEIEHLNTPDSDGTAADTDSEEAVNSASAIDLASCRAQLRSDGFALIDLKPSENMELGQVVVHIQHGLLDSCPEVPRGVFLGGTPQNAYLAVALHPLRPQDFDRLWTA